jgi:hypothetical protein
MVCSAEQGVCVMAGAPDAGCTPRGDELCNGLDDDCDDTVDEGHDDDGDGYTWCGSGEQSQVDCDDENPARNPGAMESCNGADEDCDEAVDETTEFVLCEGTDECIEGVCQPPTCLNGAVECGPMQRCDTEQTPPTCVDGKCETEDDCDPGQLCDSRTGQCVRPQADGAPCQIDLQCESESCFTLTSLGLSQNQEGLCARACCADSDCSEGTFCYVVGNGTRACLPSDKANVPTGIREAGSFCSDHGECASGFCPDLGGSGRFCLANCRGDASCPDDRERCARIEYARPQVSGTFHQLACDERPGAGFGDDCGRDGDCASNLCAELDLLFDQPYCTRPCATSRDCEEVPVGFGGEDTYCGYLERGGEWLAACIHEDHSGSKRSGAACQSDDECEDRLCDRGQCADTCCASSQCDRGFRCKPIRRGSHYEMRCRAESVP